MATAASPIIIGTRGSRLALWQANWVKDAICRNHPDQTVDLKIIKTKGDKILDVPLAKVGGKGLFVKEIEDALLGGQVDLAVHSMKDVPTTLPEELMIAAILEPRVEEIFTYVKNDFGDLRTLAALQQYRWIDPHKSQHHDHHDNDTSTHHDNDTCAGPRG